MTTFTATTDCPRCDTIAVHWLDTPRKATPQQWADYEAALEGYEPFVDSTRVEAWGGQAVKTILRRNPPPQPPTDEQGAVTRVCVECGLRWEME
ncbi:hypothetical protein [Mycolicibacterium septicum]|uniref:hypothetical protein n=1 Tax=Mycolicibacterium septicum TaxID=98668 RepID=UPI001AF4ABE8|nr:hypothetical protein [Mycolicibacterium septicum]QRY51749.1 hypothetical protein JVX95_30985 [Mycolicibacterium septicum]